MARKRISKMMLLSISAGIFNSTDEALKEANSLKIFLLRLAEKNGYSVNALIGVSEVSTKLGRYEVVRTGKRGRPRKEFVKYMDKLAEKQPDPHIHILFVEACPADMICNLVISHINKKYKDRLKIKGRKSACWKQKCTNDLSRIYNYVARQSKAVRRVNFPKKKEEKQDEGIIFTTTFCGITEESKENVTVCFDWGKRKNLECNIRLSIGLWDSRKKKGIAYYRRPP